MIKFLQTLGGAPSVVLTMALTVALTVAMAGQGALAAPASTGGGEPAPAGKPAKKRAAPEPVAPVVVAGVRYEPLLNGRARGLGQNGGVLLARDATSGAELYTLQVYTITYAANMEADKQDVHIASLSAGPDGRTLLVADERGRRYRVDIASRAVTPDR